MNTRFALIACVLGLLLFSCGQSPDDNIDTSSSHADSLSAQSEAATQTGTVFEGAFYRFTMSATEGCFLEFKDASGEIEAFRSKCEEEYAYASGADTNEEVVGTKFKIWYETIATTNRLTGEPTTERKYLKAEVLKNWKKE